MAFRILGTGSCLPEKNLSNLDLCGMVETSDEWITTRTGIKDRKVISTENFSQMCITAAERALKSAGVAGGEIDLVLCSLLQGDVITPSTACVVAEAVGAQAPAFDLNGACSGFLYCLDVAKMYFEGGRVKKVLVIAAEAMSRITDWTDRSTCVLFGDGAGAVVLGAGDNVLYSAIGCKPDSAAIRMESSHPATPFAEKNDGMLIRMNGAEVYKFAVTAMAREIDRALEATGLKAEQIDWLLPHQANMRIIEAARKKLSFPPEKVLSNIERYGNMSSASIAVLLDESARAGKFKAGDVILTVAFGAGLTYACNVFKW